ncbi:MAG: phosphoadenosine phosphosulfate reductase family protein [Chloroflexota bacterium]
MGSLATRSNPISRRVMKPLPVDVFTAARERIRHVYETYDRVVVSYSGGKDSTCVLELAIQVAGEMGKLPVNVLFFDEEVLLPETEAMVMRTRERPEIDLKWVCGQVHYWDASSNESPHWVTWDLTKKDLWVREPPPLALWMGEMRYPAPGDAIARLWGPEHGRVAGYPPFRLGPERGLRQDVEASPQPKAAPGGRPDQHRGYEPVGRLAGALSWVVEQGAAALPQHPQPCDVQL